MNDEGFTDDEIVDVHPNTAHDALNIEAATVKEREELAYSLLASLPRSRLATVQRRIAPLLQFDVVGSLPTELALHIFSHLPWETVLLCALVSQRWRALADDQAVWKRLCRERGWEWKQPHRAHEFGALSASPASERVGESDDDEGMGASDEEQQDDDDDDEEEEEEDSGFASMLHGDGVPASPPRSPAARAPKRSVRAHARHSAPSALPSLNLFLRPNYKLLHQTHVRLRARFATSSYRLSALQTRGGPVDAHTNTIYCLQLYTHPVTGAQTLFTGSRDRTVREWCLGTGSVVRVIGGVHEGSVLSICVHGGYLASAGSDRRVAVWDLVANRLVRVIADHEDSVLCVRFDDERLVSCSKDRTVRTYTFPDMTPQFVLGAHRAAVNAVSISRHLIVSGSGDRSIRLWDANTGKLLRTLENHHSRGIASIDFKPPYVISGSSDKHLRLFDLSSLQGWSTCAEYYEHAPGVAPFAFAGPGAGGGAGGAAAQAHARVCRTCGASSSSPSPTGAGHGGGAAGCSVHGDLVRSVVLGDEFVVSGSYDLSIKVWDRKTGELVADLTKGHTGRIFCIGFDRTKIVSCGEDQRVCVWDFSHGIDTSFITL